MLNFRVARVVGRPFQVQPAPENRRTPTRLSTARGRCSRLPTALSRWTVSGSSPKHGLTHRGRVGFRTRIQLARNNLRGHGRHGGYRAWRAVGLHAGGAGGRLNAGSAWRTTRRPTTARGAGRQSCYDRQQKKPLHGSYLHHSRRGPWRGLWGLSNSTSRASDVQTRDGNFFQHGAKPPHLRRKNGTFLRNLIAHFRRQTLNRLTRRSLARGCRAPDSLISRHAFLPSFAFSTRRRRFDP
jgi:hypothetical protein